MANEEAHCLICGERSDIMYVKAEINDAVFKNDVLYYEKFTNSEFLPAVRFCLQCSLEKRAQITQRIYLVEELIQVMKDGNTILKPFIQAE